MSNTSGKFIQSSLGKKLLMGLTGLFLISFLIVHCLLNSFIFLNDGGVMFNEGAQFMANNPIIRIMEIVLFFGLIAHAVQALVLTLQNNKARPIKYAVNNGNANSTNIALISAACFHIQSTLCHTNKNKLRFLYFNICIQNI